MKAQTVITRENKQTLQIGDKLLKIETFKALNGTPQTREVNFTVKSLRKSKNGLRIALTSQYGWGCRDFDPEYEGVQVIYLGK